MSKTVTLAWPTDGVALVTVNDRGTSNHNITFSAVGALADTLEKARESRSRLNEADGNRLVPEPLPVIRKVPEFPGFHGQSG